MPGVGLILIPFDGGRETHLSASEAKSHKIVDNPAAETRLSELIDQRPAMEGAKFMFTDRGVLMHGSDSQALIMSRLVSDLSNLMPSERSATTRGGQFISAANDDKRMHITPGFSSAASLFKAAPVAARADFNVAANDEKVTITRGYRPAISGSQYTRAVA